MTYARLRANSGVLNRWRNLSSPLRNARSVSAATSTGENASVGVSPVASSRRKSASTSSSDECRRQRGAAGRRRGECRGCSRARAAAGAKRRVRRICHATDVRKRSEPVLVGSWVCLFHRCLPRRAHSIHKPFASQSMASAALPTPSKRNQEANYSTCASNRSPQRHCARISWI